MSDKRFRIVLFTLGILVGIIVGAVVVVSFIEKKPSSTINEDNLVNKISNNVLSFLSSKKNEAKKDSVLKGKSLLRDVSFSQQNTTNLDEDNVDEKKSTYVVDSANERIEVKKDELIKIVALDVELKSTNNNNKVDSILNNVAGIKNEKVKNNTKMFVEFWQSPINYKGYQMTKNKLVVFGIEPNNAKKIITQNDKTYLICSDWAYKLDFNTDFKSLEKISINELQH